MRYHRWCVATLAIDGWPEELRDKIKAWSLRLSLGDGRGLFDCEFEADEHEAAQKVAGIIVLPSLTAPASKLPSGVLAWLQGKGITPAADDTVLNVLRALRDKFGANFSVDLAD
jgi:hypothetical protein